ncbi:MAG: EAL domain-containing protein [Defluviitaleaceae bacterium]|nr:EAL domain-containing protein [Defluviitaleaceae bacterium]
MRDWLSHFALRIERVNILKAIRDGFAGIMPILLIGAFIFMLVELQIPLSLDATPGIPGLNWHITFEQIYVGVLGIIPIAAVVSISYSLALHSPHYSSRVLSPLVPALVGLSCLFLLVADPTGWSMFFEFGTSGVFIAVIVAVGSHLLFFFFYRFRLVVARPRASTSYLAQVVQLLEPALFTILIFAVLRFIFNIAGESNIPYYLQRGVINMLAGIANRFNSQLAVIIFFTFMHQLLWFFGLHNGDMLWNVAYTAGWPEIFDPLFFEFFVFSGGGVLALIAAVFIVRWKNASRPALVSLPMGIANIGSPIVYGLPIIFNPFFLIPFIFAPIFSAVISYMALSVGMSPIIEGVDPTMPVGLSGWMATGSAMAGVIQIIGLIMGTFIYLPFAWMANSASEERNDFAIEELMSRDAAPYMARRDDVGVFARSLFEEMEYDLRRKRGFYLEYQPMIDSNNRMLSFEARVRYRHASLGPLPTELVQALIEEGRMESELNTFIIDEALSSLQSLREYNFTDLLMTISLSPKQLGKPKNIKMMEAALAKYNIDPGLVRIELCSQEVLSPGFDPWMLIGSLEAIGLKVIIDNFNLQQTHFNNLRRMGVKAIKLSNALTQDAQYNELSATVIKHINTHAKPMTIIAEQIETKAQRDMLVELGCDIFQGKYFSKPMETADLALYLRLR